MKYINFNYLDNENIIHTNITYLGQHVENILHAYFLELNRYYREFINQEIQNNNLFNINNLQHSHEISENIIRYYIHYQYIINDNLNKLPV